MPERQNRYLFDRCQQGQLSHKQFRLKEASRIYVPAKAGLVSVVRPVLKDVYSGRVSVLLDSLPSEFYQYAYT